MIDTAVLLNAGQGSRLLPLTADRPKCLIEVGGKAILDHQLDALAAAGVRRRVVIGGYLIERLAEHLKARGDDVELRFNPFWSVSSSISSVWAARDLLEGNFAILNGDTVYSADILRDGFARVQPGINLLVDTIDAPEPDDMLVAVEYGRVTAVSKALDPAGVSHRSLGVIAAVGDAGVYRAALDAAIGTKDGIGRFHHGIVDAIAQRETVHALMVGAGDWVEIDRPEDISAWKAAFNDTIRVE